MKILITSGIFPPDIGGPASYVPQIAEYLTVKGNEVQVICLSDEKTFEKHFCFGVHRILRRKVLPLRFLKTVYLIYKIGRDVDLIYANTLTLESSMAGLLLGKTIVHKVVGDYAWEKAFAFGWTKDSMTDYISNKSIRNVLLKWLFRMPLRAANAIIVPSLFSKDHVRKWGIPESKIQVIYNGIDSHQIESNSKKQKDSVVVVGRLIKLKRIDSIIYAMKKLPHKKLLIIGDGPEKSNLKEVARSLKISHRVKFCGSMDHNQTMMRISQSEILVLNSMGENFPHVIVEAMLGRTFVICNDAGGCSEIVDHGNTGYIMRSDKQSIEQGLQFFDDNPKKVKAIIERAYEIASARFSSNLMLSKTFTSIERLASENC